MAQKQRSEGEPIVIKKYANRRLYNTAKSSYVTLDDLSRMVRAGEDFKVFDAKTGDEITRSVLTQIIFEEEAKGHNMLPTNFLRQLIRLYGDALQGLVPGYLDASMETFARNQERMREAFGAGNAMQTFQAMARSNMEWFENAMKMFGPFVPGQPGGQQGPAPQQGNDQSAAPGEAPARPSGGAQDLDALQRQLSEMQAQLARLSGQQPGAAPQPEEPRGRNGTDSGGEAASSSSGEASGHRQKGAGKASAKRKAGASEGE